MKRVLPGVHRSAITVPASPTSGLEEALRRRRRWTAEKKAEYVALFSESGLSQVEFSRKMGLCGSSLSLWCRQAQEAHEHRAPRVPSGTGFAEVRVSEPMPGPTVTIYLPGGAKLEAAVGTDPAWMGHLIKASVSS
ncbi:MAG: transposase [Polyangia bacterium]